MKAVNSVVGVYGFKGGGKTTALTLFALMAKLGGARERVITNYSVSFQDDYLQGRDMIFLKDTLENAWIGIDELHEYADSRASGSLQNKRVADFFLQSRHFHCDIYYTTQYKDQCDKRIRRITDVDIVCENLFTDLDGDGDDDLFQVSIRDRRRPESIERRFRFYAAPIFPLFDTTTRINPFVFSKKEEKEWMEEQANG